ncbi:bestrophin-like domain [Neoroseomonas lacus]|uniref:DUF4239 domain-containing protein n=1 Tax=Neoroseomonas lacus TaxID=287609 RepID=A0A917NHV7_9PROT|nr:hypothetical protein [Neoroseomonas lacus]GGJ01912.1 hypothetical protein GCM10011320_05970 [Neoroseomonas lacus]
MLNQTVLVIASQGVLYFAAGLVAVQMLSKEIGYFFGHRLAQRRENPGEGVSVVVGGMLGLLAFVLALTLSFSSARFQERREGTLAEANAIGTAWLQAQAIGHPRGAEIARLLETYTVQRRDFVRADHGSPVLAETTQRTNALQSEIWGHVTAIVRERPDPVASSLMNALNTAFDMGTAERFAFSTTLPPQLFWLLIGMGAISMAALGFQLGLRQKPLRLLTLLLLCMWSATMTVILDMGSARIGNVRISTQALDWTIEGFQGGVTIPPAPGR